MRPLFDPGNPLLQSLADRSAKLKPVRALWRQVVGETASRHSEPVGLDQGVLTVWVDSSLWATKLRHQGPSIVAKINSRQSGLSVETKVSALSFRVTPSAIRDPGKSKHLIHQPVSTKTTDLIATVARSLNDQALRTSMQRLCEALKTPSTKKPNSKKSF